MSSLREFIFKPIGWYKNKATEDEDGFLQFTVSGVTKEGETIVARIREFEPWYYIELPKPYSQWSHFNCEALFQWVRKEMPSDCSPTKFEILKDWNVTQLNREVLLMKIHFSVDKATYKLRGLFEKSTRVVTKDKKGVESSQTIWTPKDVQITSLGGTFKAGKFKLHEDNIPSLIKLFTSRKIKACGWIIVKEYIPDDMRGSDRESRSFTNASIDLYCRSSSLKPAEHLVDLTQIPKVLILSSDIETYSDNHNSKLPDAEHPKNICYMIGLTFCWLNDPVTKKYDRNVLSMFNPHDNDRYNVIRVKTEKELLLKFTEILQTKDPAIILGHNYLGFDWNYKILRAKLAQNGCWDAFSKMGKVVGEKTEPSQINWSSSAYGGMKKKYMDPVGRTTFDLMVEVQRQQYRLRSFGLDAIAEHFLGLNKEDMPYKHQFMIVRILQKLQDSNYTLKQCRKYIKTSITKWEEVDDDDKETKIGGWKVNLLECKTLKEFHDVCRNGIDMIAGYCCQDVELPMQLFHKLNMWQGAEQASNIFGVPMDYLQTRGQQIKVLSQIFDAAYKAKKIIGYKGYDKTYLEKVMGAIVQDCIAGFYRYVYTFDFTSLYPSIIIAYNICMSTFRDNDDSTPDEDCHVMMWAEHQRCGCINDKFKGKCGKNDKKYCTKDVNKGTPWEGHYRFRWLKVVEEKQEDGSIFRKNEGLFPRVLAFVLSQRKMVKGQIKIIKKWLKDNFISEENKKLLLKVVDDDILNRGELTEEDKISLNQTLVVLDKRQAALKVSANSAYGGLGAGTSQLCCKQAAACVTYMGRTLITQAIDFIIKNFPGAEKVYGDTDSCMMYWPNMNPLDSWRQKDIVEKEVNKIFPKPLSLEFENCYVDYLQFGKKMYSTNIGHPDPEKLEANIEHEWIIDEHVDKGIAPARRDNCLYLVRGCNMMNKMVMTNENYEDTMYAATLYAMKAFIRQVPIRHIIYSKGINDPEDYEGESLGHVMLARRMKSERGEDVRNTRLQYVFTDNPGKLQGDKMEDYTYFIQNRNKLGLQIDWVYVMEKALMTKFKATIDIKWKGKEVPFEKYEDKIERLQEVLTSKEHLPAGKYIIFNMLTGPNTDKIKIYFCNGRGERIVKEQYNMDRWTYFNEEKVKSWIRMVGFKEESLSLVHEYINTLKSKHADTLLRKYYHYWGVKFTNNYHAKAGKNRDKNNPIRIVNEDPMKQLWKSHSTYKKVTKQIKLFSSCLEFASDGYEYDDE